MLKYLIQYKFSILLAFIIASVSLVPGSSMPESSLFSLIYLDKIVHFCMYAFFGFVAFLESRCAQNCLWFHVLLFWGIFFLSAVIEILQATVVATRSAEVFDLLANLAGLVSGYIAYRIFKLIRS